MGTHIGTISMSMDSGVFIRDLVISFKSRCSRNQAILRYTVHRNRRSALAFFDAFPFRRETTGGEVKVDLIFEKVGGLKTLAFLARFRGGIDDS